jgi:hypothetical protein
MIGHTPGLVQVPKHSYYIATDKDRASDRITGAKSNGHLSHLNALGQEVLRLRKALQRGSDLGRRQRRKPGPVVVVMVVGGWGKGDIDSKVMLVRARDT